MSEEKMARLIGEVNAKREASVKHFRFSDGSLAAVCYSDCVHYKRNGEWQDIDNRLISDEETLHFSEDAAKLLGTELDLKEQVLHNKENAYHVLLPEIMSEKSWFEEKYGEAQLLFRYEKLGQAKAEIIEPKYVPQNELEAAALVYTDSEAIYHEVLPGIDLDYRVRSGGIKEDIVFREGAAVPADLCCLMYAEGMALEKQEDGSFALSLRGKIRFLLPAPYLVDAEDMVERVQTEVQMLGEGVWRLHYYLDETWLKEPERKWPIRLDPVIVATADANSIKDGYVVNGYPDYSYLTAYRIYAGYYSARSTVSRSFVAHLTLPTSIAEGSMVTQAQLSLYGGLKEAGDPLQVNVHAVTEAWETQSTLTWNNQPSYESDIVDFQMIDKVYVNNTEGYSYHWDVTSAVQRWYAGNLAGIGELAKHGFAICAPTDTTRLALFTSADGGSGIYKPQLYLFYRDMTGIESFWDYTNASAGRAGTVAVQNSTGHLVVSRTDLSYGGNRMPAAIGFTYNLSARLENMGYGYGWRCSYAQTVEPEQISSISYYCWTDGDGTKLYFVNTDDGWVDECGLGYTLTVAGTGYTITDRDNNRLVFDEYGRLTQMIDGKISANLIGVSYVSNTAQDHSSRISTVTDGAGRKYRFNYTDELLSTLVYRGAGTSAVSTVSYAYSTDRLTQVTYPDGNTAAYTYSSKRLTKATGCMSDSVSVTYGSAAPYRVKKLEQKDGTTLVSSASFLYGKSYTKVTDNNSRWAIYQFNSQGNTICVLNSFGQALYGSYTADRPAQLVTNSRVQGVVVNLLSTRVRTSNWTETVAVTGGKMYTVSGTGTGSLTLTAGTSSVTSLEVTDNFTSASFTVPSGVTSLTLTGTGSFSDLQLEQSPVPNRYNLLRNSDMTAEANWTGKNTTANDGHTQDESTVRADLDNWAYRLTGSPTKAKRYTQTLTVSGAAGDNYTFGCWVKSRSVPLDNKNNPSTTTKRRCGVEVVLLNGDESVASKYVAINDACREWQYLSGSIQADAEYTKVQFRLVNEYNEHETYYDGAMLFKERFAYIRTYDSKGRVTKVKNLNGKTTTYTYRGDSGDLTKIKLPGGAEYTYDYNATTTLLTKTTSATGVITNHSYDSYGNSTVTKITYADNTGRRIQSNQTYTDDGNLPATLTTGDRQTTTYVYDTARSVLSSVTDANGTATTHTYDNMHRRLTSKTGSSKLTYTYTDDRLAGIHHTGGTATQYDFTYTTGGQLQKVAIGTAYALVQNTYNSGKWTLQQQSYPNSQAWHYTYHGDDSLARRWTTGGTSGVEFRYYYDASGKLCRINQYKTVLNGETISSRTIVLYEYYYYDSANRLTRFRERRGSTVHEYVWAYNANDEITSLTESVNGVALKDTYTYNSDNQPLKASHSVGGSSAGSETLTYDSLGRLSTRTAGQLSVAYTYRNASSTYTTTQISKLRNTYGGANHDLNYTYDANGNTLTVSDGSHTTTYEYDARNQLKWEYNQTAGKAWSYTYDLGGNITKGTEYPYTLVDGVWTTGSGVSKSYVYGDSVWGDLLTKYGGQTVASDGAGNITGFDGATYTWQSGHQLVKTVKDGTTVTYTYNDAGLRTQKKVGSDTYTYYYRGGKLIAEIGPDFTLYFRYNKAGEPVGVTRRNSTTNANFTYIKNQQGDILGLLNSSGAVVAAYTYDAWGKPLSIGPSSSLIATQNPLRYRGYAYDSETELYYLKSRYYDPKLRRFLSPDSYAQTYESAVGANMFAYCLNNPCNYIDSNGNMAGRTETYVCADYSKVFKLFDSIEDAARSFGKQYYQKAMRERKEYGAEIIATLRGGEIKYYLSSTVSGSNTEVNLGTGTLPTGFAGSVHIHVLGKANDGEHFSKPDTKLIKQIFADDPTAPFEFYLILPNRVILGYGILDDGTYGETPVGNLIGAVLGGGHIDYNKTVTMY